MSISLNSLQTGLRQSAIAFRGYNITNLGRSHELLNHAAYGPIVRQYLQQGSQICSDTIGRKVDLVDRVQKQEDTTLETYSDAISLIVSMELAQLELLQQFFDIDYRSANFMYGYSLGEISAVIAGGVHGIEGPLNVLLELANDAVELAHDVTLGIVFSRGPELSSAQVNQQCLHINNEGQGTIGVSAYLSPNSLLVLGQGNTLDRLKKRLEQTIPHRVYLKKNKHAWPPMHTNIVWERHLPNRAAVMMHTIEGGFEPSQPEIFSLVSGQFTYKDHTTRELLRHWIDHPQRLWDAIYETLKRGIETVIHVGPAPNLIPATFERLRIDVAGQTQGNLGMRALSNIIHRPWLSAILPSRTAILRAPQITQLILEDWLLEQTVP